MARMQHLGWFLSRGFGPHAWGQSAPARDLGPAGAAGLRRSEARSVDADSVPVRCDQPHRGGSDDQRGLGAPVRGRAPAREPAAPERAPTRRERGHGRGQCAPSRPAAAGPRWRVRPRRRVDRGPARTVGQPGCRLGDRRSGHRRVRERPRDRGRLAPRPVLRLRGPAEGAATAGWRPGGGLARRIAPRVRLRREELRHTTRPCCVAGGERPGLPGPGARGRHPAGPGPR